MHNVKILKNVGRPHSMFKWLAQHSQNAPCLIKKDGCCQNLKTPDKRSELKNNASQAATSYKTRSYHVIHDVYTEDTEL